MKKFNKNSIMAVLAVALVFGLFGFARPTPARAAGPAIVNLLTSGNFVILSKTGITNVPTSAVTGNIGTSPITGASITGVGCSEITGSIYTVDASGPSCRIVNPSLLSTAVSTMEAAYTDAAGRAGPDGTNIGAGTLVAGTTFTPGLYKWTTAVNITGTTTLSGGADDVWIFQIAGNLDIASAGNIASGVHIELTGGAKASNVFWQVGGLTGATLGTYSTFNGTILTAKQIIMQTGAVLNGRALAQTQVTLDQNTVSLPTDWVTVPEASRNRATPNSGSLTVVKTVVNDSGGIKLNTSFPLFVNGGLISSGATNSFSAPASYIVSEASDSGYTRTFSGDCNAAGLVNLVPSDNKICIVTNNDIGVPSTLPVPPLIDVVKIPNPLALPGGPGPVTYTYTLRNVGTVPVTNVTMVGDTCSPINLAFGDDNSDSKLDVNETWVYRCSTILSQTHTNTVVATGWANGISAVDIASATVVVGAPVVPPLIHITKIPNSLTLAGGGGMVTYTKRVTNPGTIALSNVNVIDDKCSPVTYISGDTNGDAKLDTTEVWTYTCRTNLTQTTTNTANASGVANGLTARDFALATVVVAMATPILPNTGLPPKEMSFGMIVLFGVGLLVLASLISAVKARRI